MKYILITVLAAVCLISLCGCDNLPTAAPNTTVTEGQETRSVRQCPSCEDNDPCTADSCSTETGFECVHAQIAPCCGNKLCEQNETCSADCPECKAKECETASFDYTSQTCVVEPLVPCCGNKVCEPAENASQCEDDCPVCETRRKCMRQAYDYAEQDCVEKPIVPCCGNDICDRGEDCDSCSDDCGECEAGLDLSQYPGFLRDGTLIVVGDQATSRDVMTASAMTTALVVDGVDTESNVLSEYSDSMLSSRDLIVIGGPCENSLWERFQGVECSPDFLAVNRALIKLVAKGNREIVYLAGSSAQDTQKAAEALNNHDDYDFEGTEAEFDTAGSKAKII